MTKNDPTAHARGERYRAKQEERQMVRVHLWVPEDRREDIIEYAETLRAEETEANAESE